MIISPIITPQLKLKTAYTKIDPVIIVNMRVLVVFAILAVCVVPVAWGDSVLGTTSKGTLDVRVTPSAENIVVEFLNPSTDRLQEHVDYALAVYNDDMALFGPIPLTHTTPGKVTIPAQLLDGVNTVDISVHGILFIPIEAETVSLDVVLGSVGTTDPVERDDVLEQALPSWIKVTTGLWVQDQIDDQSFINAITYLIGEGIIIVQAVPEQSGSGGPIPDWVKSTAGYWSENLISDTEFLNALQYLISQGIIVVQDVTDVSMSVGGVDLSFASSVKGSPDSPITIIEFGDYQCPNCKAWFENTRPSIDSQYVDSGIARIYFVDLAFIGPDSVLAAAATYCAQDQDMYWEFHNHMYGNQRGIQDGWASGESLVSYASDVGLDTERFTSCLAEDHTERVSFNVEQAAINGITRTPSFILVGPGGVAQIEGNQPFATFDNTIQELLN